MRARMLAIPLLAAAAALPALAAAPASADTTASTSALASHTSHSTTATPASAVRPAYEYWYVYDSGLDEATCVSWGQYFYAIGSAYGWQCQPDANGDGYFTLLLEGVD